MPGFSERSIASAQRLSVVAILVAGTALRLWQYLGNASLWIDEIAVAENVLHRPLGALLDQPLAFDQVAPPGFLALLKGAAAAFGPSELALRLAPLLCALVSLPLFAAVALRVLGGWTAVFGTGLFALGAPFILHGAEVKQYSADIAVSLLLTLVALAWSTRLLRASSCSRAWSVPSLSGSRNPRSRCSPASASRSHGLRSGVPAGAVCGSSSPQSGSGRPARPPPPR